MSHNENYKIYNSTKTYKPATISVLPNKDDGSYAQEQLKIKFELFHKYLPLDAEVLDLGCGNGAHLINFSSKIKRGIGIDFSSMFIDYAQKQVIAEHIHNISFIEANFEALPLADHSVDCVYSFAALYHILENIEKVLQEISRVLKDGGIAILDFGNARSLNKIVCDSIPNIAILSPYTINFIKKCLERDFHIIEHRHFQFFPMWGNKPWYLRPLLTPYIPRVLRIKVFGKMLDEWLSSLPIIKYFAFRHLIVLRKK